MPSGTAINENRGRFWPGLHVELPTKSETQAGLVRLYRACQGGSSTPNSCAPDGSPPLGSSPSIGPRLIQQTSMRSSCLRAPPVHEDFISSAFEVQKNSLRFSGRGSTRGLKYPCGAPCIRALWRCGNRWHSGTSEFPVPPH